MSNDWHPRHGIGMTRRPNHPHKPAPAKLLAWRNQCLAKHGVPAEAEPCASLNTGMVRRDVA